MGDRLTQLEAALVALSSMPKTKFLAKSSWLENPAVGEALPHNFLNGVIKIASSLEPLELLAELRRIETLIDPERSSRGRKLARKIDIDILLYGDLQLNSPELVIPHPRMFERDFVMKPLQEIGYRHPEQEPRHPERVSAKDPLSIAET